MWSVLRELRIERLHHESPRLYFLWKIWRKEFRWLQFVFENSSFFETYFWLARMPCSFGSFWATDEFPILEQANNCTKIETHNACFFLKSKVYNSPLGFPRGKSESFGEGLLLKRLKKLVYFFSNVSKFITVVTL